MKRRAEYETTQCRIMSKIRYLRQKIRFICNSEDFDDIERSYYADQTIREIGRNQWVLHRLDRAIERSALADARDRNARLDTLLATHRVYLATWQTHAKETRATLDRCEQILASDRANVG